jgi:hypothetical protein
MEEVGLVPSDTGKPGGKKVGQGMTHYVDNKGKFALVFKGISKEAHDKLRLKYLPAIAYSQPSGGASGSASSATIFLKPKSGANGVTRTVALPVLKSGTREKYSCSCGINVWGKPGLNLVCGDCKGKFEEA